jgi:hypothetical protein
MTKELAKIEAVDITINLKPRRIQDSIEVYTGFPSLVVTSRWLARWYKCFNYRFPLKSK